MDSRWWWCAVGIVATVVEGFFFLAMGFNFGMGINYGGGGWF